MMAAEAETRDLLAIVLGNPDLAALWRDWSAIALPDSWLVAGCIAQTVWNHRFGLKPAHGIADIDLVYFDAADLSEACEARQAARLRAAFPRLGCRLDVKNEARVHLWYEAKFGNAIRPYRSLTDAIDSFPTTATALGLRPWSAGGAEVYASFGLGDLMGGVVRPNRRQITPAIYAAKTDRWRALWPGLDIRSWDQT